MTRRDDYEIGKGKPPKSTQFAPGRSGNPNGRPKGRKNYATEIDEIMKARVPVTENGRSRMVTCREALLLRLRKKALEGDGRSMDRFLELAASHAAEEAANGAERKLNSDENEILARFIEHWQARQDQEDGIESGGGEDQNE